MVLVEKRVDLRHEILVIDVRYTLAGSASVFEMFFFSHSAGIVYNFMSCSVI
jgi:hypothetical protein